MINMLSMSGTIAKTKVQNSKFELLDILSKVSSRDLVDDSLDGDGEGPDGKLVQVTALAHKLDNVLEDIIQDVQTQADADEEKEKKKKEELARRSSNSTIRH